MDEIYNITLNFTNRDLELRTKMNISYLRNVFKMTKKFAKNILILINISTVYIKLALITKVI